MGHGQGSYKGFGRGQEYNRGLGGGQESNRGQRFNGGSGRGSDQGQRGGRPTQFDSNNRYCMVCKERGHNNLLQCSKFPDYIPRGNNVLPIPKEVCKQCLSTAGPYNSCNHIYPKDYKDWICNLYKLNLPNLT